MMSEDVPAPLDLPQSKPKPRSKAKAKAKGKVRRSPTRLAQLNIQNYSQEKDPGPGIVNPSPSPPMTPSSWQTVPQTFPLQMTPASSGFGAFPAPPAQTIPTQLRAETNMDPLNTIIPRLPPTSSNSIAQVALLLPPRSLFSTPVPTGRSPSLSQATPEKSQPPALVFDHHTQTTPFVRVSRPVPESAHGGQDNLVSLSSGDR